jgi:hypothetical protein
MTLSGEGHDFSRAGSALLGARREPLMDSFFLAASIFNTLLKPFESTG